MKLGDDWIKCVSDMIAKKARADGTSEAVGKLVGKGVGDGFVVLCTDGYAGVFVRGKATKKIKKPFATITDEHQTHIVMDTDRLRWALEGGKHVLVKGKGSPRIATKYLAPLVVLSEPVSMRYTTAMNAVIFTAGDDTHRYIVMPMRGGR